VRKESSRGRFARWYWSTCACYPSGDGSMDIAPHGSRLRIASGWSDAMRYRGVCYRDDDGGVWRHG
jgi:hypothetical protein